MSSFYESLKSEPIDQLKTPLRNIVLFDALITTDLLEGYFYKKVADYLDYMNDDAYSERNFFLTLVDKSPVEAESIINNLKIRNTRCTELAKKIYDESYLSKYISYSEVSTDLTVSVKCMFILSASKANPGRLMVERINSMLRSWAIDFKTRSAPTDEICRRSIYLSVFCPSFLEKQDGVIVDAITRTKGGTRIFEHLDSLMRETRAIKTWARFLKKIKLWFSKRSDWKFIQKAA